MHIYIYIYRYIYIYIHTRLGGLLRGALSLGPEVAHPETRQLQRERKPLRLGGSCRFCHIRPYPWQHRFATEGAHPERTTITHIRPSPWMRRFATEARTPSDPQGIPEHGEGQPTWSEDVYVQPGVAVAGPSQYTSKAIHQRYTTRRMQVDRNCR